MIFAIYLTAEADGRLAGTVINNVVLDDGVELELPDGQAMVLDADRRWPIGSVYAP